MKSIKIAYIVTLIVSTLFATENSSQSEYNGIYKPLYNPGKSSSILNYFDPRVLDSVDFINSARDSMHIDFEGRQITYNRVDTLTGLVYSSYHYNEMSRYFDDMFRQSMYDSWKNGLKEKGRAGREKRKDDGTLVFQAPAHLPRWAKRIVGDEPPKLSITGTQKLKLGYRRTKTGEKDANDKNDKQGEFIFQPSTEFSIKGTVGRLLELEIRLKGNKKDDGGYFDDSNIQKQLEEIRIHYHSDSAGELEDDIIQEVIIGKTSFSMPGLGLIGYPSGGDGGLFGVKVKSKIGPLDLTTIASIENVQNEEKTINLDAGSRPDTISEKQYVKNRFFFTDLMYRELYIRKDDPAAQQLYLQSIGKDKIPAIEKITLYEMVSDGYDNTAEIKYVLLENSTSPYKFKELSLNKDYFLNSRHNFVRFNSGLRDNSIIIMEIIRSDTTIGQPTVSQQTIDGKLVNVYSGFALLKNNNQKPGDTTTYPLMMRNVYEIKRGDGTDFTFDIVRKNNDATTSETNDANIKFIEILGLTKEGIIDKSNAEIFDHENGYLFIPPFYPNVEGEDGAYPFTATALGSNNQEGNTNIDIYWDTVKSVDITEKFQIATSSSEKMESFSLGFGIVEGTEKLWNGSDTLVKNVDYTISYFSGTVDLLSSKAKSYSELKATYQKESLFLLDKKVLLGMNGMLKFPNIGRNSYLSTTILAQLMNAKSITPKIGTEPYNRFAIGANLLFDFEPEWMTRLVNRLPGIETEAKSSARLSLEIAHSSVKSSAKNDGKAYIDNFSTSEQNMRLESSHERWYRASLDFEDIVIERNDNTIVIDTNNFYKNIPAWNSYWYKPLQENEKTNYNDIYPPDENIENNENEKVSTLKLVVQPFPDNASLLNNIAQASADSVRVKPWAGITRGLSGRLTQRKDDRYFEFWVDLESQVGDLYIDFGEISEDLSLHGRQPNNREDYEKFSGAPTSKEDIGIDKLNDTLEYWCFPKYDPDAPIHWVWDSLPYGSSLLGEFSSDPSRDNWKRYDTNEGNNANKAFANGTDGSNSKYSPQFVEGETEDFNKDGKFVNITGSQYFRYIIPMNMTAIKKSPYFDKVGNNADSNWVHIRIPISVLAKENELNKSDEVFKIVGSPSWDDIEQVRILWKNIATDYSATEPISLEFEGMQFVGNQWAEYLDIFGKTDEEIDTIYNNAGKVTATVKNHKKDGLSHLVKSATNLTLPNGVVIDTLGKDEQANYSLVLNFDSVSTENSDTTEAFVAVERKFESRYSTVDFSPYQKLEFVLADITDDNVVLDSIADTVWFSYRFGNNDSSYYEYRVRVAYSDTTKDDNSGYYGRYWNQHAIELKELTRLKLDWFNVHGERYGYIDTSYVEEKIVDSVNNVIIPVKELRVYSATNNMPSLRDIKWMSFGILSKTDNNYSGTIMLNSFQASGLRDYKGTAMKTGIDLKWADLLDNNVGLSYRDATFRSMSDDVHKSSSSEMDGGFSSDLYLDKFMPSKWGVRLPIGGSANAKLSRPELRPNSDVFLRDENDNADGFGDMSKDFINLLTKPDLLKSEVTESEKYQTENNNYRFYTSYKKTKDSKNPFVNLTADRFEFSYDYTEDETNERQGVLPKEEREKVTETSDFHIRNRKNESQNFKMSYDLSPQRKLQNKLKLKPFKKLDNRKIRKIEFALLPKKVSFGLMDVAYSRSEEYNSIDEVVKTDYARVIENRLGMDHSFEIQYEPIKTIFEMTSNVSINRNFDRYLSDRGLKAIRLVTSDVVYDMSDIWGDYSVLNSEENRNRKINFKLTPNVNSWLTLSMKMNTNYSQDIDLADEYNYMKSSIKNDVNLSSTFQLKRFFDRMAEFQKKRDKRQKEEQKEEKVADKKEEKSNSKKKKKDVFFKRVAKGLDKVNFERIKFSYDAGMDLKASYLDAGYVNSSMDSSYFKFLRYSMGLYGRSFEDILTGHMDDYVFGGVRDRNSYSGWHNGLQLNSSDKRTSKQKFSVSSSFDLPKPLDLKFNTLSLKWSKDLFVTPKVTEFDTTITWPDIKVGMRTSVLEKVGDIKKHFRNLNLSTAFNYNLKTAHTSDYWDLTDSASMAISTAKKRYTTGYGFRPFVKLDGTLKKKRIDVSYSMDLYFDTTHTDQVYFETSGRSGALDMKERYQDSEKRIEKDHRWTFKYNKKGKKGKTIKVFRNKEIKIKGDVSYKGEMGLLINETRKFIADVNDKISQDKEPYKDRTFTLKPSITYELTDKVSGIIYYDMRRQLNGESQTVNNKDEVAGEITIKF